jgi:hypothetical protein
MWVEQGWRVDHLALEHGRIPANEAARPLHHRHFFVHPERTQEQAAALQVAKGQKDSYVSPASVHFGGFLS